MARREHVVVVGLGFGDEGKGAVVDALCQDGPVEAVVRFNGGAQAAHNVVVGDRHHTFSQFGSGTLAGVPTLLSRHVLVEPIALASEARELAALGVPDPLRLLSVDADALLTTPIHVAANRAREDARGADRHGSCGKGIGETVWYSLVSRRGAGPGDVVEGQPVPGTPGPALTVGDCADPVRLRRGLDALARFYAPLVPDPPAVADLVVLYRAFHDAVRTVSGEELGALAERGALVFEGAQGVLLDQWRGFHPHTTWSTVTPDNARGLLAAAGHRARVLGVTRTYQTRHGAGPLPTEDPATRRRFPERHNAEGRYQGGWRAGHLDAVLLRYAVAACGGVDGLAVTHLDHVAEGLRVATAYRGLGRDLPSEPSTDLVARATPVLEPLPRDPEAVLARFEELTGVPVVVTGSGPDRADYRVRTPVPR
ncbi:adenylosuccinate synthetase [Saccharothrix coeruleofusca]|uniref:Adenylosuccinate synthetase n=1 Tax=Saccharothrix coeruleofusca TaxID=33919 RepID=A0A918EFZ4_9PSEU|nr:adenylosuccinate synthetase [Saccharothrix coeruleofusca]MBP2335431.1 adenylosuccinate synthase [Saccharothrix coeruleofusca]GGP77738.1 adenylosuccinate synthetase [Saccharothrix coeruleofusca]